MHALLPSSCRGQIVDKQEYVTSVNKKADQPERHAKEAHDLSRRAIPIISSPLLSCPHLDHLLLNHYYLLHLSCHCIYEQAAQARYESSCFSSFEVLDAPPLLLRFVSPSSSLRG